METTQLKILLERYFEGKTSLQEEQALLDFFAGDQGISRELIPYRQHFNLLSKAREPLMQSTNFENRLSGLIDRQVNMEHPERNRKLYYRYAAAATIVVLIGLSSLVFFRSNIRRNTDTYSDPQIAYVEAQKTLLYVSQTMNRGIKPLSNVSKINTGAEKLEHLNKLDNGMKMLNFVSIINKSSNLKK